MAQQFEKSNIASLEEHVSNIALAKTEFECLDLIKRVFDFYEVGHGCLHGAFDPEFNITGVWRNVPEEVQLACKKLEVLNKHPAVKLAINNNLPFDMFHYRSNFPNDLEISNLFTAFENNNIQNAYVLPIRTKENGLYALVVARMNEPIPMNDLFAMQSIASTLIMKMLLIVKTPGQNKLSRIQSKILYGVSVGLSNTEICSSFGFSQNILNIQFEDIVSKLGANNIRHAAILANIDHF